MKLFEYEAKEIAQRYGVPIPSGFVASTPAEAKEAYVKLNRPSMIKAQVLVAGRGKAGAIKPASSPEEAERTAASILAMTVKGETVAKVLVEEKLASRHERYVSIVVDRSSRCYTLLCSTEGGVDIEQVASQEPEKIIRHKIDPLLGLQDFEGRTVAKGLEYSGQQMMQLATIIKKLYQIMLDHDAELIESNPLIETEDGKLIAADLRILIDDNSLYRHPDLLARIKKFEPDMTPLEIKAREKGLAYVELDGDVGIIGNGAGLVMATLDMIIDYNGKPANFCDVGGGASEDRIAAALEVVLGNSKVKVLLINIMGGITRCDDVARAILDIQTKMGIRIPMVIRLVGTNEKEGQKILAAAKIPSLNSMEEAAAKAVALLPKVN
ncbi:MAG TPA: ADP-forming succinate--CoA ligase subunit beta [Candidatus Acidoferrales bacterium]|nr:ADP-forming succinate--CoA ligase subunit beta [Candidatus Acidoferrales bacterium]